MKKLLFALSLLAALMSAAWADDADVSNEQIDYLEDVIYGSRRNASLMSRLDNVEKELYGTQLSGTLSERQSAHVDFLQKTSEDQLSLLFKMNILEWNLGILNNSLIPLLDRMPLLEIKLEGASLADRPIAMRAERLLNMVTSEPASATPTQLPQGTVARLELMETLSPSKTKKGDKVLFRLTHDIFVGDALVAAAGTPASAVVTRVRKPRSFGRPSEIDVSVESLMLFDGTFIPVTEGKGAEEAAKFEASYAAAAGTSFIGAVAFGPVGLIGGFFIRGNAKEVPAGSIMYVETENPVRVLAFPVPNALKNRIAENKYVDVISNQTLPPQKPEEPKPNPPQPAPPSRRESELNSL